MRDYQNAMKADPGYFECRTGCRMPAAIDAKGLFHRLGRALNQALALQPNSADARYAFAWLLVKQGFYKDGANELAKLLSGASAER